MRGPKRFCTPCLHDKAIQRPASHFVEGIEDADFFACEAHAAKTESKAIPIEELWERVAALNALRVLGLRK